MKTKNKDEAVFSKASEKKTNLREKTGKYKRYIYIALVILQSKFYMSKFYKSTHSLRA